MLPDFAEARYSRGRVHFELGHIDEAMADYDQAIKLDPKDVDAYNSRGHTYYTLKQWDLAVPEYKRAIEIDPKFSGGHQNLATTYVELKEYRLALEEYDRALELDPENTFIYAQRVRDGRQHLRSADQGQSEIGRGVLPALRGSPSGR